MENSIQVFISLGSNVGNREMHLEKATELLNNQVGLVIKKSKVIETPSWPNRDKTPYLNQVIELETRENAMHVLNTINEIEQNLGRKRTKIYEKRTIDIDILFYGNCIIDKPNLVVPHPLMHQRIFVLSPMTEIAPDFLHPVLNIPISEIKTHLENKKNVATL